MKTNLKCFGLNDEYFGMVRMSNKEYKIKNLLPNEEAVFEVSQNKKYCDLALVNITKESKERIKVNCPNYNLCGGCQMLHMNYPYQISLKKKALEEAFKKELSYNKEININYLDDHYHYRNKAIISFKYSKTNRVTAGLYEENSHKIIPNYRCLIQREEINQVILDIIESINENKISVYNQETKTGFLRHALIRIGSNDDILITFVTTSPIFHGSNNLIKSLINKNHHIKTIIQNINNRNTSIVLGEEEKILYGNGTIKSSIDGYSFLIGSKTFYQINEKMAFSMYQKALEKAGLKKTDVLVETYSGISTIGIIASKYVGKVYSVELNKDSTYLAKENIKLNNIHNLEIINSDSTKYLTSLNVNTKIDCLILDPPREGSTIPFLNQINKLKIKKIIYISCDYHTQIRDLKVLLSNYQITYLEGFEMFPNTKHVETVCCLSRKNFEK